MGKKIPSVLLAIPTPAPRSSAPTCPLRVIQFGERVVRALLAPAGAAAVKPASPDLTRVLQHVPL